MTYTTGAGTAATVSSNYLTTYNTSSGFSYVYGNTSTFSSPYSTTLSSNSGLVTWTFNFRWNRNTSNPAAPASGAYGQAIVLASSGTNIANGSGVTGYAIVYGSSGTPDPIRLVRFSGGVAGTLTDVITSTSNDLSATNNYVSVRVTYNPSDNKWSLYLRDDGATAWVDPTSGTLTQKGSAIVDNTYTSTSLSNFGFLFSTGGSSAFTGDYDNFKVTVASAATCFSPTLPTTTGITSSNATLGWTAPTSTPASGYQYYISTSSTAPDASTAPTANVASGTSANVTISPNTTYYWWVRSNCSTSDKSSWVSGGNFTTPQLAASFPYNENFEGSNGNNWTFINGSQTNKWYVGTAVQNGGTQSLYISNNSGASHSYTISPASASSVVQAYRDIAIPSGSTSASISFDWRANGEGSTTKYDYFSVWMVPVSFTPTAGSVITTVPSRIKIGDFNLINSWGSYTNNAVDVSSFAGTTMRLVFEWQNDSSGGSQAPAAIDNLALTLPSASTTVTPTSLTGFAATTASDSAQQSFTVSGVSLGSNNITITPSAGYQISTTSGSGYSSTPIVLTPTSGSVASTTIYAVLKKSATTGAANGTITVSSPAVTPDKTINLTGTITKATFTSIATGNWESASTWDLNAVPSTADNVVIVAAHTVTATTSQTRDSGTTTTVAGTLATNASYLNNGTTTINGTFQINTNGFGGGSNDFVYGISSNLVFSHNNGSEYGSIDATHKYWPSAGPVNVTINANSPVNLGVARTVTGVLQIASGFRNLGNITIGTNGTLKLNSGYSWLNANSSPTYGTSSSLNYNSGGSPGRSNEWTASTGTVGTTAGLPQNVQVSNNTTVNFPNGSTNSFRANGILTIDSGSSLYQNYSGGSAGLIVGGNFVLNGNLGLGSNEGGDITVGGNWTQAAAATFQPNGRKVIFNGTVAQTIQKVGGGAIDFDKIEINKTNATNVAISNSVGNLTDVNINGNSSNVLSITGAGTGSLTLQNRTLTFNNNGGFIYVDAAKAITAATGAIINVNGSKAVANNSGTGTLSFPSQVTINLNQNGVLDFGKSTDYISTVSGTLNINHSSASVNTNPPIYATGSKLVYKSGGTYARKVEWSTTTGAGYPYDVQVTNNTTLDYPNTGSAAFNASLGIANDLTIDSGSSLYMSYGDSGNKSGSLTIGRNIINSGNFSLGNASGGDLNLGGNWTSSGTFIPNDRAVNFNGDNNTQTINSATVFDYLAVNKTNIGSVNLSASIIVNKNLTLASRSIVLGAYNLTLPNKLSVIASNSNSYINATGVGKLVRQNLDGTQDWVFPMGVAASGRYAPITFKNLSGTTDLSVNVNTSITPTVSDATRVLSTKWFVTTANNVTANIYTEWQGIAAETNSMIIPSTGSLGTTVGGAAYSFYNVNLVANNTMATAVSLSNTGANGIVIGNDNAIRIANDDCSGATNVVLDAAAVSGSNAGATNSIPAINCGGSTSTAALDVWYKFTTTDAGTYKIEATPGTISDLVLELRSGVCNGTNLACSDTFGTESISILLDANTTYYYRIYKFGSGTGTFTTSVSTVPSIIVTPVTLAFGDVTYNTTSDKTFTVKANFLNPASDNISIASLSGYEYSLNGITYSASLILPYTNKTLGETTVHVRFLPTLACTDYNGNIAISGGGATTVNVVITGKGAIQTPVANTAIDITTNSFVANWNLIAGVDYEVEVGTQPDIFKTNINEDFTGFTTNNGSVDRGSSLDSYLNTTGWTGAQVYEMTGYSKLGSAANKGIITTPSLDLSANGGNATLKVDLGLFGTDTNKTVQIMFAPNGSTFTQVGGVITLTSTITTYTVNITGGAANSKIRIQAVGTSNNRFYLDNFIVAQDSRIPGYNPLQVSNTSQLISGLSQETQYYYRVRAKNGSCYSAYSSIIPVMTNNTVIWNNNAWTNTTGPDVTLDAIIRTPYYVKANSDEFTVKNLTIENTGLLKIKSGHGITISGDVTAPDDKIIIESDASLTQTKIANGNTNNKAIAKRNVKMKTLDYTYWSSPMKDQVLLNTSNVNAANSSGGFSPGTPNNRTYEYNEVTDNFRATINATFVPAKGYAIRGKAGYGTGFTLDSLVFRGNLHNGDYSIQIQKSKSSVSGSNIYEHGYNLIGNPYPSNINFISFYNLNQGNGTKNSEVIFGKAWFWTNFSASATQAGSTYAGNNYATITLAGGTAPTTIDSAEGNPIPNEYIKVAQGFIVQMRGTPPTGTTPSTGTVKFDNSIRTNNNTGHFYNNNNKNTDEEINRYWVKMISPYNIANTILLAHMDGASNEYDADYDAELLAIGDDSFYSKINSQKLQIQARSNPVSTEDFIVLGTKYAMNGVYKISLSKKEGIFVDGQKIYLKDKLTDTYTDLTTQDYSFSANQGTDENRFEIVYKNKEVLASDNLKKSDFVVYRDGNEFVIKSSKTLGKIELYDVSGKLIISSSTSKKELRLDVTKLNSGIYIIKADNSGAIRTKKIMK